jgi:hypothetical protein
LSRLVSALYRERQMGEQFRKQVCPHGSSLPCSQCVGATARVVIYSPTTGHMMIDGVEIRKGLIPVDEIENLRQDLSSKMRRAWNGERRAVRCGVCGGTGHTRKTCGKRSKLLTEPALENTRGYTCSICGSQDHQADTPGVHVKKRPPKAA